MNCFWQLLTYAPKTPVFVANCQKSHLIPSCVSVFLPHDPLVTYLSRSKPLSPIHAPSKWHPCMPITTLLRQTAGIICSQRLKIEGAQILYCPLPPWLLKYFSLVFLQCNSRDLRDKKSFQSGFRQVRACYSIEHRRRKIQGQKVSLAVPNEVSNFLLCLKFCLQK